jgi:hypothetical protein
VAGDGVPTRHPVPVSLTQAFWEDSTPHDRRLFLDEANGRTSGRLTWNFNCYDMTLDFDQSIVIVTDASEMTSRKRRRCATSSIRPPPSATTRPSETASPHAAIATDLRS